MSDKLKYVPEVFWCSYCGKNIWAVAEHILSPEQLICDDCLKIKKEESKLSDAIKKARGGEAPDHLFKYW